jgi:hypothetical protein
VSVKIGYWQHPTTKEYAPVYGGFSWPCLFFGCFWYASKGLWGMGILALVLAFVTVGFSWLVFPFLANDHHRKSLMRDGYIPADQVGQPPLRVDGSVADEIRKLAEQRTAGTLTEEEFTTRKARLLG